MGDYRHPVFFELPLLEDKAKEKVQKYFQIRRKSGGGECGPLQHVGGNTYKISFKDPEAQQRVLQRGNHVLETSTGPILFSVCLGPDLVSAASPTGAAQQTVTADPEKGHDFLSTTVVPSGGQQKEEAVSLDPYLVRYLRDCPKAGSDLQLLLSSLSSTFQLYPEEEKVVVMGMAQVGHVGKWEAHVHQVFDKIRNKYCCHYLADQKKLKTLLETTYMLTEDMKVYNEPGEGFAVIVGEDKEVQERLLLLEKLNEIKSPVSQKCVSTSCLVGEAKLSLIWKDLETDLKQVFPGIRLSQAGSGKVMIEGPMSDIMGAREMVTARAALVHEKEVAGISSALLSFLSAQGHEALTSTLGNVEVRAEFTSSGLSLLSLSKEALEEAQRVFLTRIGEDNVLVPDLPNMLRLKEELQSEELQLNQGMIRVKMVCRQDSGGDASYIQLLGYRDPVNKLKKVVQRFLEDQSILQTSVVLPFPEVWDNFCDLLTLLGVDHTGVQFSLPTTQEPSRVVLTGPKHLVTSVCRQVSTALSSLVQEVFTIDRPGSLRYFTGPGREYLQVVGRTHHCLVQLRGIPEEPSYQLEGGMCVRVQHGNITQEKADALVNAANEDLEHRGGVAQALSLAGGPEVQQACRELVRRSGKVPTGTAVATTPGQLPCKVLVHVVGPVWSITPGARRMVRAQLESAVKAALELAESHGCRSLAMPCISSGVFGVPFDLCATAIVTAVRDFGRSSRILQRVTLLDMNVEAVRAMQVSCNTLLGRREPPAARAVQRTDTGRLESIRATAGGAAAAAESLIHVKVIVGNIEDQEVDALVSPMLGLNPLSSKVGKCLMNKAGKGLENGFEQATRGRRAVPGDVVLVEGKGALNVCCVFFVRCERWAGVSQSSAAETLRRAVRDVLRSCESWGFVSVAFPVIGTGRSMGFPHSVVAQILLQEIQLHEETRVSDTALCVFIVIHPSDKHSAAAFEASQNAVHLRGFQMSILQGRAPFYRCISLTQDEVSVMLGAVKLQLVFGDIIKETTDVIVNSTNFTSEQTGVSKAILTAAGKNVQDEFDRVKSQDDGICFTLAGALACKIIVHICANKDLDLVKKLCGKVLKFCEHKGYRSVAFPAVCAGGAGLGAPAVASSVLDGLACAVRDSSFTHLSLIRIVLLLRPVFEAFRSELESRLGDHAPSPSLKERSKKFLKQILKKDSETSLVSNSPAEISMLTLDSWRPLPAVVCVTGPGQQALRDVQRDLEAVLQKQLYDREFEAEDLAKLSREDLASLMKLAQEQELSLQPEGVGERPGIGPRRYVVRGLKETVLQFSDAVQQALTGALCRKLREREEVLMFLSVQWMILTARAEWEEMDLKHNYTLEQKYQENNSSVLDLDCPGGDVLKVDLGKMEATSKNTGLTCRLKRMEQHTEYNPPSCWDPMAPGESIKKVLLEQDSPEYRDVAQNFLRTATGHTIHKIERVQNIHLWRSYWGKMQQFTEKNGVGQVGEKFLYHGTSVAACDSIKREGFNRSFAGKHATRHGVGVYFAVHASYSASLAFTPPDQAGLRYMYVARVLTGHYTVGTEDMKVPPLRSGTNPPDRFDSLVNAANNPSMFVIFHDDQAYPDYLITFR